MDDEWGAGTFDVGLAPIPGGARGRRRAQVVFAASGALIATGIALAMLAPQDDQSVPTVPTRGVAQASVAVANSPSITPVPSAARVEALLPFENVPLAGAPNPFVIQRVEGDAQVVAWDPGDALRIVRVFPGAFGGITEDGGFSIMSPDATTIVTFRTNMQTAVGRETVRLSTERGLAWEGDAVTARHGVAWSGDSRQAAFSGKAGTWWLVTIDEAGVGKSRAIDVGDWLAAPSASPAPIGEAPDPSAEARPTQDAGPQDLVPTGFSVDGKWLYGGNVSRYGGGPSFPSIRVRIRDGQVEPVERSPIHSPSSFNPASPAGVDPTTGRSIRWGPNAATPGGPPTVEVIEPDGTTAYRVETRVVVGLAWASAGQLLILEADGFPYPTEIRLRSVSPDGTVGEPILTSGAVEFGGIIGARDGFAIMAFGITEDSVQRIQLVALRLEDGAASALTIPPDEAGIVGAGLLP
jgi:hypothetical protein